MPLITQLEQVLQFTGERVLIGELSYLLNIRRISRVNKSGKGYVTFVPNSAFPPFSHLETGEFYIFSSLRTGYTVNDGPAQDQPPTFSNDFFDT